jgi:Tfp pilus assembly protein PilN
MMKRRAQTALGIDISETFISLALVRSGANGLQLIKAARLPMPQNAIENANIKDPSALAKSIRTLMHQNKIKSSQAAVSLLASPTLLQIVDMPEPVPENIGRFVEKEVEQCVALSGRSTVSDFYGIGSKGTLGRKQLLITAADTNNVAEILNTCKKAGINVKVIEPPLLAYARAIHAKKIASKLGSNVLIAILRDGAFALAVFRKNSLDFVRIKNINKDHANKDRLTKHLAEEISATVQFYDIEVPDNLGKWEITIADDTGLLPRNVAQILSTVVKTPNLQVKMPQNPLDDVAIDHEGIAPETQSSATAIGLAMGLLVQDKKKLRINLFPSEATQARSLKKQALITANVVAAILFIMVMIGAALELIATNLNVNIDRAKLKHPPQHISMLVQQNKSLEKQIKQLSGQYNQLNGLLGSCRDISWPDILEGIKNNTPNTVCITDLFCSGSNTMSLEGLALSYDVISTFINTLEKSGQIGSASLVEAGKDTKYEELIKYEISCALTSK